VARKTRKPVEIIYEPFEVRALNAGAGLVAGIDEAGRGCLAGPVSVGLTIFPVAFFDTPVPEALRGLTDSKLLSPAVRDSYFEALPDFTLFQTTVLISNKRIDADGIMPAIRLAILSTVARARRAGFAPDHLLVDGNYKLPQIEKEFPGTRYESITKGDSRVFSIAAASILAKVTRDRRMTRYDRLWPGYGLTAHKGYGTQKHRDAISHLGPAPLHRRSYKW